MTTLFLLRHGATRLNLEVPYRLQGSEVDEGLAPVGVEQAVQARELMRPVPLRAMYTSPLLRARQTADIVATPHALEYIPVPLLREGSVGRWENRTWEEIKVTEPEAYQRFMENPAEHGYAGGENMTQVLQRVKPVFLELLQKHDGDCIGVVGHQIVNRVMVADLLGLPLNQARKLKFSNGGVTVITMEKDQMQLVSLNIAWPAMIS